MDQVQQCRVAVAVMILKAGKILVGKRKSVHRGGEYGIPGGHLEFGETFEDCAKREVAEEAGLSVTNIRFQCIVNLFHQKSQRHYTLVYMVADWLAGDITNKETEKCEGWDWYSLEKQPAPLVASHHLLLESLKNGQQCFSIVTD